MRKNIEWLVWDMFVTVAAFYLLVQVFDWYIRTDSALMFFDEVGSRFQKYLDHSTNKNAVLGLLLVAFAFYSPLVLWVLWRLVRISVKCVGYDLDEGPFTKSFIWVRRRIGKGAAA